MSEEIDMTKTEKMVEKGFKELYDKKKQKRETAFADGVRFANLQMWYILKEQENEIERLNNVINKIQKYCKENQIIDRLELLCIVKEHEIDRLYDKIQELKGDSSNE